VLIASLGAFLGMNHADFESKRELECRIWACQLVTFDLERGRAAEIALASRCYIGTASLADFSLPVCVRMERIEKGPGRASEL